MNLHSISSLKVLKLLLINTEYPYADCGSKFYPMQFHNKHMMLLGGGKEKKIATKMKNRTIQHRKIRYIIHLICCIITNMEPYDQRHLNLLSLIKKLKTKPGESNCATNLDHWKFR